MTCDLPVPAIPPMYILNGSAMAPSVEWFAIIRKALSCSSLRVKSSTILSMSTLISFSSDLCFFDKNDLSMTLTWSSQNSLSPVFFGPFTSSVSGIPCAFLAIAALRCSANKSRHPLRVWLATSIFSPADSCSSGNPSSTECLSLLELSKSGLTQPTDSKACFILPLARAALTIVWLYLIGSKAWSILAISSSMESKCSVAQASLSNSCTNCPPIQWRPFSFAWLTRCARKSSLASLHSYRTWKKPIICFCFSVNL